ncbi:MAG TPA: mechanosensitive ion channel family protein, partial [Stellaceae bacterium]
LATASDASRAWDLRCELREKMIAYLQSEHPDCLPRRRLEVAAETVERSDVPTPRIRSVASGR